MSESSAAASEKTIAQQLLSDTGDHAAGFDNEWYDFDIATQAPKIKPLLGYMTQHFSLYRDLHCWEMDFSWVPTGFYRNFKLEIRLKAPQLQDVKVTKQESAREIF